MIWLINKTILNIAQLKWSLLTQSQVHMLTLIRKIMKEVPDLKLAFMWHYQNTKIFLQSAISKVDLKMLLWLKKLKILCWGHTLLVILTLFRMGFSNLHTYPTMMILGSYTLPKKDPKNIWITWHTPWVPLTSAIFHRKSANFAISRNTCIDCILIQNF